MSVLPMDFSFTLQAFDCPYTVQAFEKSGKLVGGRWVEEKENLREITSCILLNVNERTLELIAEGNLVDEAYCIMFEEGVDTLYIQDQQDASIQPKQSYLLIDGKEFIVQKNPETVKNANFKSYYAIRYKAIKDVISNP